MREPLVELVTKLLSQSALLADAAKADKGNKAATTRVRTGLMQLAKDAKALRTSIVPVGSED